MEKQNERQNYTSLDAALFLDINKIELIKALAQNDTIQLTKSRGGWKIICFNKKNFIELKSVRHRYSSTSKKVGGDNE